MSYLKILYMALNLLMLALILYLGFKNIEKSNPDKPSAKRKKGRLLLGLVFWQLYMLAMANTGFFQSYDFPPRFVLCLILPLFIFTGVFFYVNRNEKWISNTPLHHLTLIQSFRILIESLFILSIMEGILHPNVTIEGYNFDMLYALTALPVAWIVFKQNPTVRLIAKLWNYLGLVVIASIIFVFMTTIFFPGFYGSETRLMSLEFATYPYLVVAGFLMPLAVFIHVWSLMHLRLTNLKAADNV